MIYVHVTYTMYYSEYTEGMLVILDSFCTRIEVQNKIKESLISTVSWLPRTATTWYCFIIGYLRVAMRCQLTSGS